MRGYPLSGGASDFIADVRGCQSVCFLGRCAGLRLLAMDFRSSFGAACVISLPINADRLRPRSSAWRSASAISASVRVMLIRFECIFLSGGQLGCLRIIHT